MLRVVREFVGSVFVQVYMCETSVVNGFVCTEKIKVVHTGQHQ